MGSDSEAMITITVKEPMCSRIRAWDLRIRDEIMFDKPKLDEATCFRIDALVFSRNDVVTKVQVTGDDDVGGRVSENFFFHQWVVIRRWTFVVDVRVRHLLKKVDLW